MPRHLLVALVLLGVAVGAGVHYDATEERHWPYPTADQLSEEYSSHVGEEALLWGTVRSIDPDARTATIEVEADAGTFTMQGESVEADVEPGGVVQVYGLLRRDHVITAESVVVVERSPAERSFKYGISAAGALLALAAFFRYWRFDRTTMTFEPR